MQRSSRSSGRCDLDVPELLHVGSCIPRKRIDLLLRIVASVVEINPRVRLVKAGGSLTAEQQELARSLGVDAHIVQVPFLETGTLAALYRRASVALVTSEREGFGLPVVEALASGTPVIATDIPVLREVGGGAASYAPLGDIAAWQLAVLTTLRNEGSESARVETRRAGIEQARRFTWDGFADSMAAIYMRVAAPRPRPVSDRVSVLHVGKFYPPARGGMEKVLQVLAESERAEVDNHVLVANEGRGTRQETLERRPDHASIVTRSELVQSRSARPSRGGCAPSMPTYRRARAESGGAGRARHRAAEGARRVLGACRSGAAGVALQRVLSPVPPPHAEAGGPHCGRLTAGGRSRRRIAAIPRQVHGHPVRDSIRISTP